MSICRASRQRAAPSERRTAISCARPAARDSIRFARFTHAISSIVITAPNNTYSICRASATRTSNKRLDAGAIAAVGRRVFLLQLPRDRHHLRAGRFQRDARLQAAERGKAEMVAAAVIHLQDRAFEKGADGQEDVFLAGNREVPRQHADHRDRCFVEHDLPAERVGCAAEFPSARTRSSPARFAERRRGRRRP